jgi:hypothetical protein
MFPEYQESNEFAIKTEETYRDVIVLKDAINDNTGGRLTKLIVKIKQEKSEKIYH